MSKPTVKGVSTKTHTHLTVQDVLRGGQAAQEKGYQTGLKMASMEVKVASYATGVVKSHIDVVKAYAD